jgi:hypothetical protein
MSHLVAFLRCEEKERAEKRRKQVDTGGTHERVKDTRERVKAP